MTAPVALQQIQAEMASLQAQINALSGKTPTSSTAASSSAFASTLDDATSGSTSTGVAGSTGVTGADVVADAKKYIGVPYVWGGESNSGLDCSGLVQKTFGDLGIKLPRVAADQQKVGTPVDSLADAQPGDLLFFGNPAHHVAIYAGNNQLIEAPQPGEDVHLTTIYDKPTTISRIVQPATATSVSRVSGSTGGGLSSQQLVSAGLNPAVGKYAGDFAAAESKYSLPTGLLAAVCQQESGGNASAVSGSGAQGLMQLMPGTARSHGVNAFDPAQAIQAAAQIFHGNLKEFHGSIPLALAAYNAGAGAVQQYGGIPPYSETQNYVKSISAMLRNGG
jgi:cell wall-associated NlpC family hydrolase